MPDPWMVRYHRFRKAANRTEDNNLGRLQDLIGRALSDYQNDRAPDRAERVISSLQEAFDLILRMRSSRA